MRSQDRAGGLGSRAPWCIAHRGSFVAPDLLPRLCHSTLFPPGSGKKLIGFLLGSNLQMNGYYELSSKGPRIVLHLAQIRLADLQHSRVRRAFGRLYLHSKLNPMRPETRTCLWHGAPSVVIQAGYSIGCCRGYLPGRTPDPTTALQGPLRLDLRKFCIAKSFRPPEPTCES